MNRSRGQTNPYTVILLLGLAAAAYFAYFYVPLYLDHLEVREAVDQAWNVYVLEGAVSAKSRLLLRTNNYIGEHTEVDEDGVEQVKKGLGIVEEQIIITDAPPNLSVRLDYDRVFIMKPSDKRRTVHFSFEKKGAVKR